MKCSRCGYEWESRIPNPKECPRCKQRLNYVGALGIKKGGVVKVARTKWGAIAVIIVVAVAAGTLGISEYLKGPGPAPGPTWNTIPVFGLSGAHNNSGIIAVYCIKTNTDLNSDPDDWDLNENYYCKFDANGQTGNVPSLTDFYVAVHAIGNKPYVVGNTTDNIKVTLENDVGSDITKDAETITGGDFSWSSNLGGSDNIEVSAVFGLTANRGSAFNITSEQEFKWKAIVGLWY